MTVKKEYAVGDTVWIYGVNRSNTKPVAGKVIKIIDLKDAGFAGDYYIIEVPTHIDSLLELRTWETISQDERGPVGGFRNLNIESTVKYASKVGFVFDDNPELDSEDDGPSPDEIHAALQKSQMDMSHGPLDLKDSNTKSKRRQYKKKKA